MSNHITDTEIELESPNGPKVVYSKNTPAEEIEAAIPVGWEVDWETTPADVGLTRKASPLYKKHHLSTERR